MKHPAPRRTSSHRFGLETLENRHLLTAAAPMAPLEAGGPVDAEAAPTQLLPDAFVWASQTRGYLYDYHVEGDLLRFTTALANRGDGHLEIRGGDVIDGSQQLYQRIYNLDGSHEDALMDGQFTFHPGHGHIHFDGYAVYALRTKTPEGLPGEVIATGGKVSFCLLDITRYSSTAGASAFDGCGIDRQGISAGWSDVYDSRLPDQFINIATVPDGTYFLEVTVDPDNQIVESDETNNTTSIEVTINNGPLNSGDRFESNDTFGSATNLGTVIDRREDGLSIHSEYDDDYFQFVAAEHGTFTADIDFTHALGNLDLQVFDSGRNLIDSSTSTTDLESVSWSVNTGESYYIKVSGLDADVNGYSLDLDGPGSQQIVEVQSTDVPVHLPDGNSGGGPQVHSVLIGPDLEVQDVNVVFGRIDHTYLSDLHFELRSPIGTTTTFITSQWESHGGILDGTGSTQGFRDTVLDDESSVNLSDGNDPWTGTFNVELDGVIAQPLSVFSGENAAGVWRLSISDWAGGDDGNLFEWGLQFTTPVFGDIHEPNNDVAQAVVLEDADEKTELSIHQADDVDYFRLSPDTRGVLRVDLAFEAGDGELALDLMDSEKTVLENGILDANGLVLDAMVDEGELYFIRVAGVDSATNTYNIRVDVRGDFSQNDVLDAADIDLMLTQIGEDTGDTGYDLNADGLVNTADANILVRDVIGTQYGDANFDYYVDTRDFNIWNDNKFTDKTTWVTGNFDIYPGTDARDFNAWFKNRFTIGSAVDQPKAAPQAALAATLPATMISPTVAIVDQALTQLGGLDRTIQQRPSKPIDASTAHIVDTLNSPRHQAARRFTTIQRRSLARNIAHQRLLDAVLAVDLRVE